MGHNEVDGSVIYTIDENCVGCNKCIRHCPVLGANISYVIDGENKVRVDQQKCIRCGSCIDSCSHGARQYHDDTERFFNDLRQGQKISVIMAPAARINFESPGCLAGYLKANGVNMVYDVSLGADITTWAYLKAIRDKKLSSVIAQPCPAVVNYIEKYKPGLIPRLAPVHSPAVCTAIYMNKYERIKDRIAFLSPCIGKTDEFIDPNTKGYISYNVTYGKLYEYMQSAKVDVSTYQDIPFDNIACWLGCLYSRPGGLRENVEALVDSAWVRQIEGYQHVYAYLDSYENRLRTNKELPLLVDILNCTNGCNLGTATRKNISIDDADYTFNTLKIDRKQKKDGLFRKHVDTLFAMFDAKLDSSDFQRLYSDKHREFAKPTDSQIEKIYLDLHKNTPESKKIDCSACGYSTCADMAYAIFNGLNTKGNCIGFNRQEIALELQRVSEKNRIIDELSQYTERVLSVLNQIASLNLDVKIEGEFSGEFQKIMTAIDRILSSLDCTMTEIKLAADQFGIGAEQVSQSSTRLAVGAGEQSDAVSKLSNLIVMLTDNTKRNAQNANRARSLSVSATDSAEDGNRRMKEMQKSMEEIREASSNITTILKTIDDIAFQTNILALNAAIESARAGRYGKGFAVVADEVRILAVKCSDAAKESAEYIDETILKVKTGTDIANATAAALGTIVLQSNEIAALVDEIATTSNEQAGGIDEINANVQQVAHVVKVNSESSQGSAATSEQLSAQAVALKERVSKFKLRQKEEIS